MISKEEFIKNYESIGTDNLSFSEELSALNRKYTEQLSAIKQKYNSARKDIFEYMKDRYWKVTKGQETTYLKPVKVLSFGDDKIGFYTKYVSQVYNPDTDCVVMNIYNSDIDESERPVYAVTNLKGFKEITKEEFEREIALMFEKYKNYIGSML